MAAKNVLGIIFSNAYDEVLPELTALRTMGSVPFAGRYRLIDFQLSNMVNAVKKLTLSDAQSLKAILGPTAEERILRSVIDAVVFDNPQSSGTANGV